MACDEGVKRGVPKWEHVGFPEDHDSKDRDRPRSDPFDLAEHGLEPVALSESPAKHGRAGQDRADALRLQGRQAKGPKPSRVNPRAEHVGIGREEGVGRENASGESPGGPCRDLLRDDDPHESPYWVARPA